MIKLLLALAALLPGLPISARAEIQGVHFRSPLNMANCPALLDAISAQKMSAERIAQVEARLRELDPKSADYQKLLSVIPKLNEINDYLLETASGNAAAPMGVAEITLSEPVQLDAALLNQGIWGSLRVSPSSIDGNLVSVPAGTVRAEIRGPQLCRLRSVVRGNDEKAVKMLFLSALYRNP